MSLPVDTTLLTNVCNWVGLAHNSYIRVVGSEADQNSPFYWLEAVKSYIRGGDDMTTGIVATTVAAPSTTLTVTATTTGTTTYRYQVTYVAGGETTGSTEVTIANGAASPPNNALSNIPISPSSSVTSRRIYRTSSGGATGTEKLLATIPDNTTTTYTDTTADASLGAAIPVANTTGGVTVAAQGSPTNTVSISAGTVIINGQPVAVPANAAYGSTTIFTQTCIDTAALTAGQFYDAALCVDHLGQFAVFRGPREDRLDTEDRPTIPLGYCLLAMIRILYQSGNSTIQNSNITQGPVLTSFAAQTNDASARMFNDFDTGQTRLISRAGVKNELGFALTSLDKYVQTITATQGLGTNAAGLSLLAWAKATHQTTSPFDFPSSFSEFVRVLRNGKDHSQRLCTIVFTGSGTASVTDLKRTLGLLDAFELVVTSVGGTGSLASTVSVTLESTTDTTARIYTATVPANSPNGTVIAMSQTGTAALQTPVPGTTKITSINTSTVLSVQPAGTVATRVYTSIVALNPVTVSGGTSGDSLCMRNTGTL